MTRDQRGFEFGLKAPVLQAQWRYDAAQADLAGAQAALAEDERRLSSLYARRQASLAHCSGPRPSHLDPVLLGSHLRYIGHLDQQIQSAITSCDESRTQRDRCIQQCLDLQQRIDALDDICRQELAGFLSTNRSREARRIDDEWISRQTTLKQQPCAASDACDQAPVSWEPWR